MTFRADPDLPDIYNLHRAMIYLKQGKLDSSQYCLNQGIGDINRIRENQNSQDVLFNLETVKMHCDLLQAELLLASDSVDQAIELYQRIKFPKMYKAMIYSLNLPLNIFYNIPLEKDLMARALIKKGDIKGAISADEKLLRIKPGMQEHFILNPIYHYRLAKLYHQDNQIEKAINQYKHFLEIWKEADKDIPEFVNAKKRLNELTVDEEL